MNIKIMLIDAHPVYAFKTIGFLESMALKDVTLVDRGAKALDMALEHRPDIIVISATLPDASSMELISSIKNQLPAKFIVQIGLLADEVSISQFKDAGANYVVARREKDWSEFQNALMDAINVK